MIKKWILGVLGNIPACGILTRATYCAKENEKTPREAKVLTLRYNDPELINKKLVLTDSEIEAAMTRPSKYTDPKDPLKTGVISYVKLFQKSTLKTKSPREQLLICTIANWNSGECKLGADANVLAFTETQFNRCAAKYERLQSKLVFELTFKQKFAKFLGWLFCIGG